MREVISVSSLVKYLKSLLTSDTYLKNIYVEGEISNLTMQKHWYFSIKDAFSKIDCVMYESSVKQLTTNFKNGDKVQIKGYIDVYVKRGTYQVYVTNMKNSGIGDLTYQYSILKEKLFKEGLFEADLKKVIPRFANDIAVITATTGAAIHDIVQTLRKRNPGVSITIYKALVQGENAKNDLVRALKMADINNHDVIIFGRGGGSLEDLWAFNEEIVVRQIYACNTPIISGVGHESDTTLSDYVSDIRAKTPTDAAVLAIYDVREEKQKMLNLDKLLTSLTYNKYFYYNELLQSSSVEKLSDLLLTNISKKIFQIVNLERDLHDSIKNNLKSSEKQFLTLEQGFKSFKFQHLINSKVSALTNLEVKQQTIMRHKYEFYNNDLRLLISLLQERDPLNILKKGFSITKKDHKVVDLDELSAGDDIITIVENGKIKSKVIEVEKNEYEI